MIRITLRKITRNFVKKHSSLIILAALAAAFLLPIRATAALELPTTTSSFDIFAIDGLDVGLFGVTKTNVTAPIVLNCSTNISVTATAITNPAAGVPAGAVVFFTSTASGGCNQLPTVVCDPPSGSTFPLGTTKVTCTASDTCGNTTNCSFEVTVTPATVPPIVLNCSSNITVTATANVNPTFVAPVGAVVFYTSSASGGCDQLPIVVCDPPSGSFFPVGTNTVTCTATDSCKNSVKCSFQVVVLPPTKPAIVLNCSSNITVTAADPSGAVVFYTSTASGGCNQLPTIVCNPPSGSTFPVGTNTVTCTASDTCGTTVDCSFVVVVNPPPVEIDHFPTTTAQITLQFPGGGTEVVNLSGPTTVHVNVAPNGAVKATADGQLDQATTEMTELSLNGTSSQGAVSVTLDPAHPSVGAIQETANNTPGILDVPPFTATGTANSFFDVYVQVHVGDLTMHPAAPLHMTSVISHKPPGPGDTYVNPFTQPVPLLDANGNPSSVQLLSEIHTPVPTNSTIVLNCSSNITVTASSTDGAVVFYTSTATGGCIGVPSVVCNPPSGSMFPIGTTTVTCTASDVCGNSVTCSFKVTVTSPEVEIDEFQTTTAQITLQYPSGGTELVNLSGPTTVHVNIPPNGAASDTDGNGLDQVTTEMTQLELTGTSSQGPVTLKLDPAHPTLGEIEEMVNNTPGVLDVPPFTATGTANSFFDVYVVVQVGDLTLHPAAPLHMSSVISHKPPAPGDAYVNPFTQPVPVLDANGKPTGIMLLREVHTPNPTNPPPVEIDHFPNTTAEITLQLPSGGTEVVNLSGPTTVKVNIPPSGAASDTDGNGLDQVATEMTALDLTGTSSQGLVSLKLDPTRPTLGQIEETVNNTPGVLDVPPFTATGTANSFFDVFVILQVGDQTLHLADPLHMTSVITHKPPAPGDAYSNPFTKPVPVLDANGKPTGILILKEVHTPNPTNPPPVEIDHFPNTTAQITLQYPGGGTEVVNLSGPTTVQVNIPPNGAATDTDGNGLDQVTTEMTELELSGTSSQGPVTLKLDPTHPTLGQIEETANNTRGILDVPPFAAKGTANSFFDVFAQVEVGGQTLHPARPLHMSSVITHKPPAPGDNYVNPFTDPIPVLDANGNPTGLLILKEVHTPNPTNPPPVEIDHFTNTTAQVTLQYPGGGTEVVNLSGPTTVQVNIAPNGAASDTDGNGLDQVTTEMTELDLTGTSSQGPVTLKLDPTRPTMGQIEETLNNTPGILDVPPFAATGTANSFFDVFAIIQVGDRTLRPAAPLHMSSVITHKPPAPGDTYVNPFTQPVPVLDANGNPTGILMLREVHTPDPTNPPPVEIDHFANTTAQVTLQLPGGATEVVNLSGPTTVQMNIPPNGAATDTDGNGLDQVTTEMTELDLTGTSSQGPVTLKLDPAHPTLGQIEETVNNTPGVLDVPPFTATGTANSFFDLYVLLQVGDQALHPGKPLHMSSVITHKPPAPGDTYVNPFTEPVPVLDANGNPTGVLILKEVHTPNPTNPPPVEIDHFPNTTAQITLQYPGGGTELVNLSGPTTVHVNIPPNGAATDTDGNGLDQVTTEMTELTLTGMSSQGPVSLTLDPTRPTLGQIEETVNNTPGVLDVPPFTARGTANSFFDVFVEVQVGGQTLHPAAPLHMTSVITHKPPAPGDTYVNVFEIPVPVLDANGNPTGLQILREVHTPNPTNPPPAEIDHFTNTTAQITLQYPGGGTEVINLSGPTTVQVNIPPNGAASDTDGNGLDQVTTEMTELDLTGTSSQGPVTLKLDPTRPTMGQIEETVNNTPGILDVPPFAATGTANSFFDVFVVIQVGDRALHPAAPLHMSSVITHKPPAPGDTYVNPFTRPVEVLDANGNPTGVLMLREVHTPNPTNPPPVEIDHFPNTTAQITLQYPSGGTEVVNLSGPTTVQVNIPPNGAAADTDGNGLDQVTTEMTELDLTGTSSQGAVTLKLDPAHPTLGQIEETVNNTPGILDVPPFTATGTANSFFDVFVVVQVGNQTLHPATPLHMSAVISHKPPAPGDAYVNPFTTPVQVLDANGNPTGVLLLKEVHTPNPTNPPPVEIDHFPNTTAQITLQYPGGGTELVNLSGPTTVRVNIPPNGAAADTDGNGLDQVTTEMTELDLSGISSQGPVSIRLDPTRPTLGQIEETANNTPGVLDVPPFTPTGTANSFFEVFVEMQVGGQTLHPAAPLHMSSVITHKPPAPGNTYVNPFTEPVPVLDANGNPTGVLILKEVHTPNPTNPPPVEIDHFPNTTAQITLQYPGGGTEVVNLSGPTTVQVNIPPNGAATDTDGNGLDQVTTEMTELDLTGTSSQGPVSLKLDPARPTLGQIEETVNNTPGILDVPPFTATGTANSFFDVFVEVHVGGQTLHPSAPLHMSSVITHKPPAPGDTYVNPFTQPVPVLDANGNPTGVLLLREVHTPNPTNPPPVEIDHFPNTTAQITLQYPGGGTEVVSLSGPTTVQVNIPPNGAATDTDGNGLDQVSTEMTELDLTGTSSQGAVTLKLDPAHPTLGQIEETVNNTPGILDVPPFAATGTANSFFDVFVQVQVGNQILHPATALHMSSVISHKPPAPGDTYVNPFTTPVPVLDANGNPTGVLILKEVHTPNPTNPPPVEIDHFPNTTAQITLQYPGGGTEVVNLSGPTTVQVNIPPNGAASDTDGNGLDQVTTEMTELDLTGISSQGPVSLKLDPTRATLGQIEETVNNTPGVLDVPPFTARGTANSFFDVFAELHVGGQTLHPAAPLHMSSVITHKPPAPGDTYVNPFTQPVPVLDANGNPTGVLILKEVHTPNPTNPPPVEIDHFTNTTAQITVQFPGGGTEVVNLSGPTTVQVNIPPNGAATDTDGNGLDQVTTEMTELDLTGTSSQGAVTLKLDPARPALGQIEETVNNTPGVLDVPPFTATGTANSSFDVFVLLQVGDRTLHPASPLHMSSVITHKPPAPGDAYVNPFTQPVPVLDANGNPTGILLLREVHTPNPTNPPVVEIDHFPNTTAQITLAFPSGGTEVVNLNGPTTVQVNIPPNGAATDSDGNGLDQVTTEMTQMDLTGTSSQGNVSLHLDPAHPTLGQIEETVNNTPGILDVPPFTATGTANSFFDVYVEVQIGGQTVHPAKPLHMAAVIRNKPPRPGDTYVNPFTDPIQVLDANGNPTGIQLLREVHTPNPTNPPPVEIDHFPNTTAQITLQYPSGGTEVVNLSGPTTVQVNIAPDGAATDTDGNGLDQVTTEMTALCLSGASSQGPVYLSLDASHPTLGQIEETVNNTPGVLDVPPFTATGTAKSFFDVFVEMQVGSQILHPATPLHMTALITHKPPGPGDTYVNAFTQPVQVLDANGDPTGVMILKEVHTPNPTNPPPVEIDHFPNTTAQITLQYPSGGTEVVNLSGPTTVQVNIPPSGAATDIDGNGLDQVTTEMTELSLSGGSSQGPVNLYLDPLHPTLGQIEETANNTPGVLDIPPFAATGSANSYFDVYAEVQVGGQTLHPAKPLHMSSVITHKPPAPGDAYVNPFTQPVELLDANGNPTGVKVLREVHTPNPTNPPPVEIDHFPNTTAQITLQYPSGGTEVVELSGPTTVQVNIPPNGAATDTDGNGLDQVTSEMTELSLTGRSSQGPVNLYLDPAHPTVGQIEETANNTPGVLDVPPFTATGTAKSFFDVYAEVQVGGQTLHPAAPLHMTAVITHKPPGPGDAYVNPFTQPVPLLDANGNRTGVQLLSEVHTPVPTNPPPVEIDHFPNTTAQVTLKYPSGGTEVVNLSGPTTVKVNIPPNGAATDTDGNGLDQVTTEMTELSLTGTSSQGPVSLFLDPAHPTLGQIEETANNTPGILDVPPFAATGTAKSFFDVFVQVQVGSQTLHPAAPLHMSSVITHKPPAPGDAYVNPFTQPVELLDADGKAIGIQLLQEVHTPNPTNRCIVTIACPPSITVTSAGPAVVTFTVTAASTCDKAVAITANPPSGSSFPIGTTTVNCSASTGDGTATCSFTVTVKSKQRVFPGPVTLPPTNSVYNSPAQWHAQYANGILISNITHRAFTAHYPPPTVGSVNETFGSKVDLRYSTDGGRTFQDFTGDANCTVSVTRVGPQVKGAVARIAGDEVFQTEMLQLDLSGGNLPPNVRLRESPTLASIGQTTITPAAGGFMVSSFFDVFTEISLDGGNTWSPSSTPGHMELHIDSSNPLTFLVKPRYQGGEASFSVQTQLGLRYTVQYQTNLGDPNWTTLQIIAGSGLIVDVTDTQAAGAPRRFYRVQIDEDPNQ